MKTKWTPLFHESEPEHFHIYQLWQEVEAAVYSDWQTLLPAASVSVGLVGSLLFSIAHLEGRAALSQLPFPERIFNTIGHAVEKDQNCLSLFGGVPGFAWLISTYHDRIEEFSSATCIDFLQQVDATILNHLDEWPGDGLLDLTDGLAGIGVYGACRPADLHGSSIVAKCAELIQRSYRHHSFEPALSAVGGAQTGQSRGPAAPCWDNLGLAHGLPGIIAFLAKAQSRLQCKAPVTELLRRLLDDLLAARLGRATSVFPYNRFDPRPARNAWCYGSPGIAFAVLAAGRALDDSGLISDAHSIALGSASQFGDETGVQECSLCHGSAGLALMYSILAHQFDDQQLRQAAQYWCRYSLSAYSKTGIGGFVDLLPGKETRNLSLLNGAMGVALCLMSTVKTVAPTWTSFLALDV